MAGMLSDLFKTAPEDPAAADFQRALLLAQQGPFNAAAMTGYEGAAQAGRGIRSLVGAATGTDVRTPEKKRTDAIEAVKQQVAAQGLDPNDPNANDTFYRTVIMALQKQGMFPEALDVGKEWQALRTAKQKADTADRESERKAAKDEATKAYQAERNRIMEKNGLPNMEHQIRIIEGFDPITQAPQREIRLKVLNAQLENLGKGIILEDAGDRVIVRRRADGAIIGEDRKGETPMSEKDRAKAEDKQSKLVPAYRNAIASIQATYDAVVRLYNHPGLEEITGRSGLKIPDDIEEKGLAGLVGSALTSDDGRNALGVFLQIKGGTFLAGLNDLKRESAVGSTGLGQVSNVEGAQVRNAAAALDRRQDTGGFRESLRIYLAKIVASANRLSDAFEAEPDITIQRVNIVERPLLAGSGGKHAMPVTRRKPAPAASAAAPSAGVRMIAPDGTTGTVPADKVEAAKAQGFKEAK